MPDFQPLIVCNEEITQPASLNVFFAEDELDSFGFGTEQTLDCLVFELLKKPRSLVVHVQRIYFC